jgi:3-keto-disaccharide hydrolase
MQSSRNSAWFPIRLLTAIVLSVVIPTGMMMSMPPETWTSLSSSTSFEAWREDNRGWKIVGDVALTSDDSSRFDEKPGSGTFVSDGDASNLESREEYQDVDVRLEFMIPEHSNSGVKLSGRYEIQILDTYGAKDLSGDSCGGIYPRAEEEPSYHHIDRGVPPRVNAAKRAGEWQSLEIEFIGPRFDANGKKTSNAKFVRVVLNGKVIHKDVEVSAPTGAAWRLVKEVPRGPLLLQGDHGRVAFRNIQVRHHD